MAANFDHLLNKPAADVKRPPPLPPGTYYGSLGTHNFDVTSQKQTPYVRFQVHITSAGPDIDSAALADVDLAKRVLRKDFYLTEDAEYRLVEFLKSCGIKDENGASIGQMIAESPNAAVMFEVIQRPGQNAGEIYNDIATITGATS